MMAEDVGDAASVMDARETAPEHSGSLQHDQVADEGSKLRLLFNVFTEAAQHKDPHLQRQQEAHAVHPALMEEDPDEDAALQTPPSLSPPRADDDDDDDDNEDDDNDDDDDDGVEEEGIQEKAERGNSPGEDDRCGGGGSGGLQAPIPNIPKADAPSSSESANARKHTDNTSINSKPTTAAAAATSSNNSNSSSLAYRRVVQASSAPRPSQEQQHNVPRQSDASHARKDDRPKRRPHSKASRASSHTDAARRPATAGPTTAHEFKKAMQTLAGVHKHRKMCERGTDCNCELHAHLKHLLQHFEALMNEAYDNLKLSFNDIHEQTLSEYSGMVLGTVVLDQRRRPGGHPQALFSLAATERTPPSLPPRPGYSVMSIIGEGTYGVVYKALQVDADGSRISPGFHAIKALKLKSDSHGIQRSAVREVSLLREFSHPNVLPLLDVILDAQRRQMFLVFPFLQYDLHSMIRFHRHNKQLCAASSSLLDENARPSSSSYIFPYTMIRSIMWQLLCGLEYLHANWILHADIKPNNLLISFDGALKIADFGLSRLFKPPVDDINDVLVTLWYRSPELLVGVPRCLHPAIDIWSVGCVMAEMYLLNPLFSGEIDPSARHGAFDHNQLTRIFNVLGHPSAAQWPGLKQARFYNRTLERPIPPQTPLASVLRRASDADLAFVAGLLEVCPQKRISAAEALRHPFFHDLTSADRASIFARQTVLYPPKLSFNSIRNLQSRLGKSGYDHSRTEPVAKRLASLCSLQNAPFQLLQLVRANVVAASDRTMGDLASLICLHFALSNFVLPSHNDYPSLRQLLGERRLSLLDPFVVHVTESSGPSSNHAADALLSWQSPTLETLFENCLKRSMETMPLMGNIWNFLKQCHFRSVASLQEICNMYFLSPEQVASESRQIAQDLLEEYRRYMSSRDTRVSDALLWSMLLAAYRPLACTIGGLV